MVDAVSAILEYVRRHANRLLELEVNPLLALPDGAVAVDALIRLYTAGAAVVPAGGGSTPAGEGSAPSGAGLEDVG